MAITQALLRGRLFYEVNASWYCDILYMLNNDSQNREADSIIKQIATFGLREEFIMGIILDSIAKRAGHKSYEMERARDKPRYDFYYSFVPTDSIDEVVSAIARVQIMASLNNSYGSAGDTPALMDLKNRNDSEADFATPPTKDIVELRKYLDYWVKKYDRPELITKRLLKTLLYCATAMNTKAVEKSVTDIVQATEYFHKTYLKMLDSTGKAFELSSKALHDHYVTGETTGLGFGLITNSVSHALLYQAWDQKERNNQLMAQTASVSRASKSIAEDRLVANTAKIKELYSQYSGTVIKAVVSAYETIDVNGTFDENIGKSMNDSWLPVKKKIDEAIKWEQDAPKRAEEKRKQKEQEKINNKKFLVACGVVAVILAVLTGINAIKAPKVEAALDGHSYSRSNGDTYSFSDGEISYKGDTGKYDVTFSPFGLSIKGHFYTGWNYEYNLQIKDLNKDYLPARLHSLESGLVESARDYYLKE